MPNPTRQEFEAVAKHVMETAPSGLSRDAFFGLIEKELAKPLDTVQNDPPSYRWPSLGPDEHEPDTFAGGFLRSLKNDFLGATVNNSVTQGAAHPKDLGDFLGLILPAGYRAGGLAKETAESGVAAAKGAEPGMLNRVRGFWKGVGQDIQAKPTAQAREEMMLNGGAKTAVQTAAPAAERDLYSAYKAKPTPTAAPRVYKPGTAPPSTSAPTLEDALSELLKPEDARMTSLPPEQGITSGGATKQSGVFPKKQSVGQAGGYSSGRPGVTQQQYDDVVGSAAATPEPPAYTPKAAPVEPPPAPVREPITVKGQVIRPDDPLYNKLMELSGGDVPNAAAETAAQMLPSDRAAFGGGRQDELLGKLGGNQAPPDPMRDMLMGSDPMAGPRVTKINPDKLTPQLWGELRRYFGSEKLAQLTGKSVEEVKQLAPGPSLNPLEVEDRLNQNPDGLFKHLPQ